MATDLDTLEYETSLIYEVRSDMAVGGATKLRDAHEKLKRANHLGFDEAADGSMLVVYLRFFTLICVQRGLLSKPTRSKEASATMDEHLTKAHHSAQFAMIDLQAALKSADAVTALVLMPMIANAASLAQQIDTLIRARPSRD